MAATVRLKGWELLDNRFGGMPTFHDSEILKICFDRAGPSASFWILMGHAATVTGHSIAVLKFDDIEDLDLRDWNYQNVIHSLILSATRQPRFTTGKLEDRVEVRIESVFGATCRFTCSQGEVLQIEETPLQTGRPFDGT